MPGTVIKDSKNKQSSARAKGLCVRQYLRDGEVAWEHLFSVNMALITG